MSSFESVEAASRGHTQSPSRQSLAASLAPEALAVEMPEVEAVAVNSAAESPQQLSLNINVVTSSGNLVGEFARSSN